MSEGDGSITVTLPVHDWQQILAALRRGGQPSAARRLDRVLSGPIASTLAREREAREARTPCPEGFHWIGQSFASCDRCGLPAWEHAGQARPAPADPDRPLGPFAPCAWVLQPWDEGEAEAMRRRYSTPL